MKSDTYERENFLDMESEPASTSEGVTDFTFSTYKDQTRCPGLILTKLLSSFL
jgi:hypothetical protein